MRKVLILLLFITFILYLSAEKSNKNKKKGGSINGAGGHIYPGDIIESVQSDLPGDPQIKIRFAGSEDADDDATISTDDEKESEEDEEEDEDVLPIKKKKLPRSKPEDIHTFL